MRIQFEKMEGAGNDFIMIDNRTKSVPDQEKSALAKQYCRRTAGIGADGMVFVETDPEFDFAGDFYNPDGTNAGKCLNAAGCAARFAKRIGAAGKKAIFRTTGGPVETELTEMGAKVRLPDAPLPKEIVALDVENQPVTLWEINVGVPHAIVEVSDLESVKVKALGRAIRYHRHFAPNGTNVDFFRPDLGNAVSVRTYEQESEDETSACGTGAVAASIVAGMYFGKASPIMVKSRGDAVVAVHFRLAGNRATDLYLESAARVVFSGMMESLSQEEQLSPEIFYA